MVYCKEQKYSSGNSKLPQPTHCGVSILTIKLLRLPQEADKLFRRKGDNLLELTRETHPEGNTLWGGGGGTLLYDIISKHKHILCNDNLDLPHH